MKIFANTMDDKTKEQLRLIETQDAFKDEKIRIMPDCHSGKGCVIGFTSTYGNKIIPNIIGVDIGCGVMWSNIPLRDFDLSELDVFIKKNIPAGMNVREQDKRIYDVYINQLRCKDKIKNIDRICGSMATLGGGNHFIEVDVDEDGCKYLVVHTGSRNLGKQVAEIYQTKAIENLKVKPHKDFIKNGIEMLKAQGKQKEIESFLLYCKELEFNKDILNELCYLEGQDMEDYLNDMFVCETFAHTNRTYIMDKIFGGFFNEPDWDYYNESIHNYIDFDDYIIRKGAIRAYKGKKVIIPLNMRDGCILGTGKGNADWNCSAPHGAGRIMSRGEARRELKLSDFQDAMKGIYTTTATQGTIDESPMAYKNAKEIIDIVKDTVSIDNIIKPIYNFKAEE